MIITTNQCGWWETKIEQNDSAGVRNVFINCVMISAFTFSKNLRLQLGFSLTFYVSILWQVITWKEFAGSEFNPVKVLRLKKKYFCMLRLHCFTIYKGLFYKCGEKRPFYNINAIVYDVQGQNQSPDFQGHSEMAHLSDNSDSFILLTLILFCWKVWVIVLIFCYTWPEGIGSQIHLFAPNVYYVADSLPKC